MGIYQNRKDVKKMNRPSKDEYYLNAAEVILTRGTCLRRNHGAVIVNHDEIIATGYTGAPRGRRNCIEIGRCLRKENNIPSGQRYELCRSVHAEANAIISASRRDMIGATLYLVGKDFETGNIVYGVTPCEMCKRLIINAGIARVVTRIAPDGIQSTMVIDWVINDDTALNS